MLRILIAGLLGAIAMYAWSSLAHVATPLGTMGVSTLPNESVTVDNLASSVGDTGGLFLFPMNMNANASVAAAPGGFLVYNPKSPTSMQPSNLILEFVTELVESILAAWLLAQTVLAGFAQRVGFVAVIGVIGAIATNIPYWNWYAFPLTYTLAQMFVTVVGYIAAGAAIAAYLRPKPA
jgi:hypothetical protein